VSSHSNTASRSALPPILRRDVTDDPTKPGAQQTQLPAVTVELLGMGIVLHAKTLPGNPYDGQSVLRLVLETSY
jgi:hypothetical protein